MELEILCTPAFTESESAEIDEAARALDVSRDEIIRRAVRDFSAACVPTHGGRDNSKGCAA